jgi:hypothetical protein
MSEAHWRMLGIIRWMRFAASRNRSDYLEFSDVTCAQGRVHEEHEWYQQPERDGRVPLRRIAAR